MPHLGCGSRTPNTNASPCSYFTSIFVSLGVFLFGYDQGVMSGIITYAPLYLVLRTAALILTNGGFTAARIS